jgi:ribosomal protein L6P/L9E
MATIAHLKIILAGVAAVIVVIGAAFTLMHRPTSNQANTSAKDTHTSSTQDVKENASVDVRVNGQPVQVKEGTTTVNLPNGTATVTVKNHGSSNSNSQSVDISVNTSSTDSSSSTSGASVSSSNSSSISVSGNSSQDVDVQSH